MIWVNYNNIINPINYYETGRTLLGPNAADSARLG